VHDRAEVPEVPRTTLVGVNVHVNPAGVTEVESATVPAKPFRLVTVIVEAAAAFARAVTVVGLAVTEKLWKVKVTLVELFAAPVAMEVTVAVSV